MQAEDFSDLARSRHSVRDFRPDPVPEEVLEDILTDARYAPSWSNTRPYCLAVASGQQADRLRAAYVRAFDDSLALQYGEPTAEEEGWLSQRGRPDGDFNTEIRYPSELHERSVKVGVGLYQHLGIARGDRQARDAHSRRNCEFFGAPTVIWVFVHERLLPFSAHDAGLMLQTLILSAWARGVATCSLGVLATWRSPVDTEFVIPEHYKLITGLALGYESSTHVNDFRADHPPIVRAPSR